jgi:hypothetical protein
MFDVETNMAKVQLLQFSPIVNKEELHKLSYTLEIIS